MVERLEGTPNKEAKRFRVVLFDHWSGDSTPYRSYKRESTAIKKVEKLNERVDTQDLSYIVISPDGDVVG